MAGGQGRASEREDPPGRGRGGGGRSQPPDSPWHRPLRAAAGCGHPRLHLEGGSGCWMQMGTMDAPAWLLPIMDAWTRRHCHATLTGDAVTRH